MVLQVVEANGLSDRIIVVQGKIEVRSSFPHFREPKWKMLSAAAAATGCGAAWNRKIRWRRRHRVRVDGLPPHVCPPLTHPLTIAPCPLFLPSPASHDVNTEPGAGCLQIRVHAALCDRSQRPVRPDSCPPHAGSAGRVSMRQTPFGGTRALTAIV
jgi:hypothetical protein